MWGRKYLKNRQNEHKRVEDVLSWRPNIDSYGNEATDFGLALLMNLVSQSEGVIFHKLKVR